MISLTEREKNFVNNGAPSCAAVVTLSDGKTLQLNDNHFTVGNNLISDKAFSESVPIGQAIAKSAQLSLFNPNGEFDNYYFKDAKLVISARYRLGTEYVAIKKGTYTVSDAPKNSGTISLIAYDDMHKADIPYKSTLSYPSTVSALLNDVLGITGITFGGTLKNGSKQVFAEPKNYTCREILGMIACLEGGNARINTENKLQFVAFTKQTSSTPTYTNQLDTSVLDSLVLGGVSSATGLDNWNSINVDEVINVTGIDFEYGGELPGKVSVGQSDYVVSIKNTLVTTSDDATTFANSLLSTLSSINFCKFSGEYYCAPELEFGDVIDINAYDKTYQTFLTDIDFDFCGFTNLANTSKSKMELASLPNIQTRELQDMQDQIDGVKDDVNEIQEDIDGVKDDIEDVLELIEGIDGGEGIDTSQFIKKDDVTVETEVREDGITYQKIIVGDKEYMAVKKGDFIFTNVGVGEDPNGNKIFVVSDEGMLTARNAMIYGTVFANGGEIAGFSIGGYQIVTDTSSAKASNGDYYQVFMRNPKYNNGSVNLNNYVYGVQRFDGASKTWAELPFGVRADGRVNMTKAVITGDVTANSLHIGNNATIDGADFVGRNHVINTKRMDNWVLNTPAVASGQTAQVRKLHTYSAEYNGNSTIQFNCSGFTSDKWAGAFSYIDIPYSEIANNDEPMVLSFELFSANWANVKRASGSTGFNGVCWTISSHASDGTRLNYKTVACGNTDYMAVVPTETNSKWLRVVSKPLVINDDFLTSTDKTGTPDHYRVYMYLVMNGNVYFRNVKLEYGNTATPWCESDSDIGAWIADGESLKGYGSVPKIELHKGTTAQSDKVAAINERGLFGMNFDSGVVRTGPFTTSGFVGVACHVNFHQTFAAAPIVTLTKVSKTPHHFDIGVTNVTTTGFDIRIRNAYGSGSAYKAYKTSRTIAWQAHYYEQPWADEDESDTDENNT